MELVKTHGLWLHPRLGLELGYNLKVWLFGFNFDYNFLYLHLGPIHFGWCRWTSDNYKAGP